MSFNSNNFASWEDERFDLSNQFTFKNRPYYIGDAFRGGLTAGVKLNERHNISFGWHWDGVASKVEVYSSVYSPEQDFYYSGKILTKSRTSQNRFFLNYGYTLKNKEKRTNLTLFLSGGMATRPGPKVMGLDVGTFSTGHSLSKTVNLNFENAGYTSGPTTLYLFGGGIQSDVFIDGKYIFSTSLQYSHTKSYLYIDVTTIKLSNTVTGEIENYKFVDYNRASGLYLSFSRKFQLYPLKWKKKKVEGKEDQI